MLHLARDLFSDSLHAHCVLCAKQGRKRQEEEEKREHKQAEDAKREEGREAERSR